MKSKFHFLTSIMVIASAAFVFTGCLTFTTTSTAAESVTFQNNGTFGQHIRTPVKDFVSAGLVFTENQFEFDSKTFKGEIFTYQQLLKEAQKLGADAIINVVIDKKISRITFGMEKSQREIWYGSALAIKYTDTLKSSETEQIYFNDDISAVQTGGGAVPAAAPPAAAAPAGEQPAQGNWMQRLMGGKK
jgi:uncharacterized protein YbjQ (UPF0145 family)